jgi:SAM-dependent methyltransferase
MKLTEAYWNNCYQNNDTGWDLGKISTPIEAYFSQLKNKELPILIPGGGNGHEAEYLLRKGFKNVFVVDISPFAIFNIKERVPNFPINQLFNKDFFKLNGTFDLIVEQTFFCAIDKNLRPAYAKKMAELLHLGGKLVGLLFDAPLNEEHPPYGGSPDEYVKYFEPYFDIEIMEPCYNSVGPRSGREVWIKMIKKG